MITQQVKDGFTTKSDAEIFEQPEKIGFQVVTLVLRREALKRFDSAFCFIGVYGNRAHWLTVDLLDESRGVLKKSTDWPYALGIPDF